MTDRYAVVGNPIAHSKSPRIHALFAEQTGEDLRYEALLAPLDDFAGTVRTFREAGGRGLNVTVPFKQEAWLMATVRSEAAERAGAVNTLSFLDNGLIRGDNTDGIGLLRDLTANHAVSLAARRVLVLGAGGAVRGILQPLLATGPEAVFIANRTADKAVQLARDFADLGNIDGGGLDVLGSQPPFDVIINGTAAGLQGELPPLPEGILAPGGCGYDMVYGDRPTAFVEWALAQGAALALDGLGMLVEQAAESFYIWRGLRPETAPVIAALRQG
ncbi:MAG: shikimate dehydrogenase [Gammaproteobacteria bacterium]|mgnify:FL=1|nr:shikimate dehydrogenase [Gammaproteobacteria bacterium]